MSDRSIRFTLAELYMINRAFATAAEDLLDVDENGKVDLAEMERSERIKRKVRTAIRELEGRQ